MKNKKYIFIMIFIVMVLVVCSACNSEEANVAYSIDTVSTNENNSVDIIAWGEVKYDDIYEISIDFPSTVVDVNVKEGDIVGLGDPLVTLNMNDYEIYVQNLQHQLSMNKTMLEGITQDTSALELDIAKLKVDITTKTSEYNNGTTSELQILNNSLNRINKEIEDAKSDLIAYKILLEGGAIPQKEFDNYADVLDQNEKTKIDIENNIIKAKQTLQDELDSLKTSLKYKQVQLKQLQTTNIANVKKQNESIEIAQNNLNIMQSKGVKSYLSKNVIISNVEYGIVRNISVTSGSTLETQNVAQKIMEIIDGNTLVINAEIPEEFIGSISSDSIARIVPTANQDVNISGRVTQIANMAIEKDGERIVMVEVTPDDPNHILKPGYSADVYFSRKK